LVLSFRNIYYAVVMVLVCPRGKYALYWTPF